MSVLKSSVAMLDIGGGGVLLAPALTGCEEMTPPVNEGKPAVTTTKPAGEETISQELCPVTGEPIDKKVFVEHDGKKIYFCCEKCVATFKKDPEKYLAKLTGETDAKTEGEHEHDHGEHK